jgi:hypothetical protein
VITLAQAATQPCQTAWTPGEVAMLMSVFSSVVIAGIAGGIVKVIEAARNAKVAVLAATTAKANTEANARQIDGLQTQVTQVALNTLPATSHARSPVVPTTFADAQLRAAADSPPPPQTGEE